MQPIPRHWATVRETVRFPGAEEWALTIHGASDLSVEDAQRDARERMQRVVAAGGPARGTGSGVEYYPLRRLPEELLEELHGPDGTLIAAITRNRYGSAVLNTDAVLISDIDLIEPSSQDRVRASGGGLLSRLFGVAAPRSSASRSRIRTPSVCAHRVVAASIMRAPWP
ncbi:hypothetical protein [Brachybacterium sp. Z12]|uniref:hypothetical protein n=1 Tax=Brachybacterium sp. Z12 TaxID=2759167 RepID=UPI00223B30ED|nr:hypothetical protein [Brachybacterium sp. Z12]